MAPRVRILAGPARSGKTAALLEQYRKVLAGTSEGRGGPTIGAGLWLAPTWQAAAEIRQRLLEDQRRGFFSPAVFTLEQFAGAILACCDQAPRFLGRLLKRRLIRQLLSEALADGELAYFGPIAQTAGLIDLIASFISDLKRQEVAPQRFRQCIQKVGATAKNHELAILYEKYQQRLSEHQCFDADQRFHLASDWLNQQPPEHWEPFAKVRCAIVDGFTNFTAAQHRLLESLAKRAPCLQELVVTLPLEKETERADLFHKPAETLRELKRRHPGSTVDTTSRGSPAAWTGLAHLERHLFANPRGMPQADDCGQIEIVMAAGQRAEIEMLARRIKDLIVLGDPAQNNRRVFPGDIVLVFRSLEAIAPLVEEVFSEYGLPTAIDWRPRLLKAPVLQALLSILRLHSTDWPYRQLLAVLSSNYFQPPWPLWQEESTRAATEWAVRQLQVAQGRRALLSSLERRAGSDEQATATDDGDPPDALDAKRQREHRQRYRIACEVLGRLAKALPSREKPRSVSDWLGIFDRLAAELGLLNEVEADRQAWQQLKDSLAAENQLDEWLGQTPQPLLLPDLITRLQEMLSVESLSRLADETGRIRVLSAQSVRALVVPYLFVGGLSEKSFPPPARDDRIYSAAEYRRLGAAGDLQFPTQHDRSCEEMLLFYEVMTRPTRQLVLSYPALDEAAQPLSPSPFLLELERCLGIQPKAEISLSPVPAHDHPHSPTERRVMTVAATLEGQTDALAQLIYEKPQTAVGLISAKPPDLSPMTTVGDNIVAGLQAIAARAGKQFSPFEGLIVGAAAQERLATSYGAEHCWSVSRLEEYATCPFRFFANNILGLEKLPELSLEIDFGRRGLLAHEALAELHRRLNSAGAIRSPGRIEQDDFKQFSNETIAVLIERLSKGNPLEMALQTIDFNLIGQWLEEYVGQHQWYDAQDNDVDESIRPNIQPTHFEVSFGLKRRAGEATDPLSTDKPFDLVCGEERIRLSGRIDRIDIGLAGGQVVFNVVDYKTGGNKRLKQDDFVRGVALQLPLYALAVQELLLVDRRAMPWRVGYWYLKEKGFETHGLPQFFEATTTGIRESNDWHALRGMLLARVAEMVRGIRGGVFPVFNLDTSCTSRCQFHSICRIGQIRARNKTWNGPNIAHEEHGLADQPVETDRP